MSRQPSSEQDLRWVRDETIAVPSRGRETRMAVRRKDWERIKRRISKAVEPAPGLSVVYSVLFGIAATSGYSTGPIAISKNLPSWVTPLYVCVSIFSFFCGCVFVFLDRKFRSERKSELEDIEADMDDVEAMFESQTAKASEEETIH